MKCKNGCETCKLKLLEWKIAVLTKVVEERLETEIDFRDEVEKFIDDFLNEVFEEMQKPTA